MNEKVEPDQAIGITTFEPARIYVCFDGSDHSRRALNTAISMAQKYNASITVAHAVPLPTNGYGLGDAFYGWDEFEKSAGERFSRILKPYIETAAKMGVEIRKHFIGGTISVVESLLDGSVQDHAELIIMGSRGVGGFRGLLIGSVSQGIASHSTIPVMIVK